MKHKSERLTLKEARLRAGLTQVELAEKSGVDQRNISKLEHGGDPLNSTAEKLEAALCLRRGTLVFNQSEVTA